MMRNLEAKHKELEKKIKALEEENKILTERAEETFLLGIVAENISYVKDSESLLHNVLERISTLQSIPYCSCCSIEEDSIQIVSDYAVFLRDASKIVNFDLSTSFIQEFNHETFIINSNDLEAKGFSIEFDGVNFYPYTVALFPFSSRSIPKGIFVFVDDERSKNKLSPMLMLLQRIVDMTVSKLDELSLIQDLSQLNAALEKKVEERTDEQKKTNEQLKKKIEERMQAEEERLTLEAQLQQVQKMEAIGTLAGGIAHQFNNALLLITGNIELLDMDYPGIEKIANYTKQMKDSAHRMAQLTSQLLAYARGGKYQAKTISINDFVENTLPIIHHVIHTDIEIITDLTPYTLNIKADQTQMQMVLSAILTNASEAIEGEGCIRVTTKDEEIDEEFAKHHPDLKTGHYVCLSVEDNGRGMDKETRNRIFEPFFTTKFEGRGLDMAAAFGIVKNHDGWISVYSEEGRGTVVRNYLPLIEPQVEEPKKPKIEPIKGTGTILIIEDEEMIMNVSRALLERLGYKVLGAMTGKEAINIAKTFDGEIDFAILDMVLPDMSGKTIYPLIMEARPNLKVLVCSGYSIDGPAQEVLDAGAQDFIQKPFAIARLSEKMKKVLEGK